MVNADISKSNLDNHLERLSTPLPISELEKVEADLKAPWAALLADGLTSDQRRTFVEYFAAIGFLPKRKAYGVKYAAPFGYSLFDLNDGEGFSVQVHEQEKIEAFHILAAHENSFLLLGSRKLWEDNSEGFVKAWEQGNPTESPVASNVSAGDVAVVSTLNTAHTIVGCIVEEYANTSYDVVTRLHDQNKGREIELPTENESVASVLGRAQGLRPTQRLTNNEGNWQTTEFKDSDLIVDLEGLTGNHLVVDAQPKNIDTAGDRITTIVALDGEVMISMDDFEQLIVVGGTTALPPGSNAKITNASALPEARLAICSVSAATAVADLRHMTVA